MNNLMRNYCKALLATSVAIVAVFFFLGASIAFAEMDNGEGCEYNGGCETEESAVTSTSTSEADALARARADAEADAEVEFYSEIDVEGNNEFYSEIDVDLRDSGNSKIKGSANNEVDIEFDVEGAEATGGKAIQGQQQSGVNEQGQETDVIVEVEINNPAADVAKAAKRAARRAAQAARVSASSNGGTTPCGDTTGLSVSTGIAGGALGTITEACRAFRATQAEALVSTKKAFAVKFAYWVGFLPRTVLHVCTLGVLN